MTNLPNFTLINLQDAKSKTKIVDVSHLPPFPPKKGAN